jgi:hypothetical protein
MQTQCELSYCIQRVTPDLSAVVQAHFRRGNATHPAASNTVDDAKVRRSSSVGGVQVRPELMRHASVKELAEKFDEHEYEHYAYMLNVLIAIFE